MLRGKLIHVPVSVERIARDEQTVSFPPQDSFLLTYQEFVRYFADRNTITAHDFVVGAHFVYGWMPTILELKNARANTPGIVAILNLVKRGHAIGVAELTLLKETINNSLVGPSKLLHFVNPESYAIWDRRVFKYIHGKDPWDYQIGDPDKYLDYLALCKAITQDRGFPPIHNSMNAKIGYPVSAYRALELIMHMIGGK